jgi:putative oxidoreductase
LKITALIARLLLGIMFLVFGLNGFLHFIPQQPMPAGLAAQYMDVLTASHYLVFVFLVQVICGFLFLIGRCVPFALLLIAPVIVNILLFHALMNPGGILPGILVTLFWFIVAYRLRAAFAGIFQRTTIAGP